MLACREVTELVTDYVEGRLSTWDRIRFRLHVSMCRHCREYVREMRTVTRLAGAAAAEPPSPEVEAALVERFRSFKRSS